MKFLLSLFLVSCFLFACNQKNQLPETIKGLKLNNGGKWDADSATIVNVDFLQQIIAEENDKGLNDFINRADKLQLGLNKIISECKMTGENHEVLHLWLVPLIDKVKALKTTKSVEDARLVYTEITTIITIFPKYFE
ncbi:MAG TPA: hypothetical protein VJA82_11540 [Sediminibacterium sp.]|uniref:hypothetical protein n=1 Tax=Sediminibacterium sp. TaxID=1917865 RepID=UPI0008C53A4B|nr:hypothetical protein [Sediminibacterium sp.]OHC84318.1 MAG: hypothetical protein A2472_12735 [Sphingobacteriia bacterium RIFOXYC2_FULL_35_18]OHC88734.1 MAG: hypothetical protein A2546_02445 [Sphingobacteriia bacterium RIFOXYD2_FULL_35_12]HLD53930.1 hypothetical protein [Sediminibacterium sp.]